MKKSIVDLLSVKDSLFSSHNKTLALLVIAMMYNSLQLAVRMDSITNLEETLFGAGNSLYHWIHLLASIDEALAKMQFDMLFKFLYKLARSPATSMYSHKPNIL